MPQGPGTYGTQKGRPRKSQKKKKRLPHSTEEVTASTQQDNARGIPQGGMDQLNQEWQDKPVVGWKGVDEYTTPGQGMHAIPVAPGSDTSGMPEVEKPGMPIIPQAPTPAELAASMQGTADETARMQDWATSNLDRPRLEDRPRRADTRADSQDVSEFQAGIAGEIGGGNMAEQTGETGDPRMAQYMSDLEHRKQQMIEEEGGPKSFRPGSPEDSTGVMRDRGPGGIPFSPDYGTGERLTQPPATPESRESAIQGIIDHVPGGQSLSYHKGERLGPGVIEQPDGSFRYETASGQVGISDTRERAEQAMGMFGGAEMDVDIMNSASAGEREAKEKREYSIQSEVDENMTRAEEKADRRLNQFEWDKGIHPDQQKPTPFMDAAEDPSTAPGAERWGGRDVRGEMDAAQRAEIDKSMGMETWEDNQRYKEENSRPDVIDPEHMARVKKQLEDDRWAKDEADLAAYEDSGFDGTQSEYEKDQVSRRRYERGIEDLSIRRDQSYEEWEALDYDKRVQRSADNKARKRQERVDESADNRQRREERGDRRRGAQREDREQFAKMDEARRMGLKQGETTPIYDEKGNVVGHKNPYADFMAQDETRAHELDIERSKNQAAEVEQIKGDVQKHSIDKAVEMHGLTMANNLDLKEHDVRLGMEQILGNERMASQLDRLTRDKMPFEAWSKQMDVWSQMETVNAGMMGAVLSAAATAGFGDEATLYAQTYILGKGNMGDNIQINPDSISTPPPQAIGPEGTNNDPSISNAINTQGQANLTGGAQTSNVPPTIATGGAQTAADPTTEQEALDAGGKLTFGGNIIMPGGSIFTPPPTPEEGQLEIDVPQQTENVTLSAEEATRYNELEALAGGEDGWKTGFTDIQVGDWSTGFIFGATDADTQKYGGHINNMMDTLTNLKSLDPKVAQGIAKKMTRDPKIKTWEDLEIGGLTGLGPRLENGQKGFYRTLLAYSKGDFTEDKMWTDLTKNSKLKPYYSDENRESVTGSGDALNKILGRPRKGSK